MEEPLYVWITTRRIKPGTYEEFSRAWRPDEIPAGMIKAPRVVGAATATVFGHVIARFGCTPPPPAFPLRLTKFTLNHPLPLLNRLSAIALDDSTPSPVFSTWLTIVRDA